LAIFEKNLGQNHPNTAASLCQLANLYRAMGFYAKALPLQERGLAIFEKTLGQNHPNTAVSLGGLGDLYRAMGDYAKALALQKRVLEIREKTLGQNHPDTATSLAILAIIYQSIGDYAKALPLFERALAIQEKSLGLEHPETLSCLESLGNLYGDMGDYAKALPMQKHALEIREKTLGLKHPATASSLNNLANVYSDMGDYAKALPLHERALEISEKTLGPEHPDTASSLNNLANVYSDMGDYAKALPLFERASSITEKALGLGHPETASSLSSSANLYRSMGDYAKALPLFERALAIREKALGPEHPDTASSLSNLAILYDSMGDYAKALPLFERALAIREKALGSEHPSTAFSLSNLANFYKWTMGDYAKALPLFERALAIREQALGRKNIDTSKTCNQLAILHYQMGNLSAAREYGIRQINVEMEMLQSILLFDENTRLSWQEKIQGYWMACILTPRELADFVLKTKGAVQDSIAEDRAIALGEFDSRSAARTFEQIKNLQINLSKIAFEKGKEQETAKLRNEIGQLQRTIAEKHFGGVRQRSSANISIEEIANFLDNGKLLIDFVIFPDPKLQEENTMCYGAILAGRSQEPVFVRIDGALAINRAINALRSAINQGNAAEVEAQTKFLSEKLWQPVAAKIPEGAKRLFICPDANLNFLSFAALLEPDGRFVAEKYPISYIGSARDLAKKPSENISKSMAIFANPQFDSSGKNSKTTEMLAMRSAEADVFGSIALPPLPGTETEAQSLGSLAKESGWNVKSALGKDATELSVRSTKKPGVLHLATHGFYLNSFTPPAPEGSRGMSVVGVKETAEEKKKNEKGVDPMRASGVALTGAQNTLSSWSQRKAPDPETDGVLTAEEVGALRLDGTWMVVLSACETGVGEARSGEGVFGLRRAFMIAGAENLLMTLWPVADETTAKIMADFYKEAFATGDAAGSLAKVQRDWLVKLRQERGLLAAIREAGPFAMVTMTAPSGKRDFVEGKIETLLEPKTFTRSDKILSFEAAVAKADAGNSYAQAIVSIYYGLGFECEQDDSKSKEYVMLSAKQQNPLGIFRLAEMREAGQGMDQNSEQATQLMQKAKSGLQKLYDDPYAMTALATIYERENPSSPKVRDLLTKAAEMGYEPAKEKLANLQETRN
jgi:tetratricopeptide (TPR) repeat protein